MAEGTGGGNREAEDECSGVRGAGAGGEEGKRGHEKGKG